MAATNQWVRLVSIDRQVRAGTYPNARSLAAELGVDTRMIFRDRLRLLEMGAPLQRDAKRGGWFYANLDWVLPAIHLSEGELLALFLSVEIARSHGHAGFEEPLARAVAKIASGSQGPVSVDLNTLRAATSFGLSPAMRVEAKTYQALCSAQARRQKVRMHYFTASRGQSSTRVVHPYHLHEVRGEWMLIAWDEGRGAVRCFNIARITQFEALALHFVIGANFDAKTFVRTMFGAEAGEFEFEVVVRFDEYQSRYIREREWHPEQKLEELTEGAAQLSFPASGLHEIARWVLGYGRHVQVLAPPELVALVRSHIEDLARLYEVKTVAAL